MAEIETLTTDDCWGVLAASGLGRLAVIADGRPDIFPVNYRVKDRLIYFSSAPGAKLMDIVATPSVAFEVDGVSERQRWSVVVHGDAQRLGFDEEIEASGILTLATQPPTDKYNYVRITPAQVTGRRFRSSHHGV